jgi:hypothetical protein
VNVSRPKGAKPAPETVYCVNCGRRLAPRYDFEWRRKERCDDDGKPIGFDNEAWYTGKILGYGVDGIFCTGGCAERFGRRCVQAGVRLKDYDRALIDRRQARKTG